MSDFDFDGRPFVAGTLTGLRSFRYTDGVLTGVFRQMPWVDGENMARCLSIGTLGEQMQKMLASMTFSGAQLSWVVGDMTARIRGEVYLVKQPPRDPPPPKRAPHRCASMGCSCGFYAYFDLDHNPHHKPGHVLGLIEGYGLVTAGARGFRAEKARIRALIGLPTERVAPLAARYPTARLFDSVPAAVEAFPLTPVEIA